MADARPEVPTAPTDRLVGQSPVIHALRTQIRYLAAFDGIGKVEVPTLLLQGETGTGKGLVARVSHDSGPRARGPFIEVNCAAIPETMLEAELFGFEAGAFSDAKRAKPGLFEAASGGTLFLDEIDALPLALQSKLLTALGEKRVRRLGAVVEQLVDAKLMAATQVELSVQVMAGRFRADLYHRLAVVVLEIPPLRARGEDILVLAEHFLRRYAMVHGVDPKRLSGVAKAWLRGYSWPGNVRELSHLLERVTLLSTETIIGPDTLARLRLPPTVVATPAAAAPAPGAGVLQDEAAQIRQVLEQTQGNVVQAARLLGLKRSTLRYRMVRAGLGSPRGAAAPTLQTARRGATLPPQESSRGDALGVEAFEPSPGWEQKLVAVLAIDLSFPMATGFEALPYEPRTVARRWEQAIEEKGQAFGGVLLQRTASPLMMAFGLPQTLDQLPQRAVQTALAIRQLVAEGRAAAGQEPVPEVRQALHLGTLLVEGQAYDLAVLSPLAGETWSVAVRLLGHARPGEVLVSPQLGRLVTGWCVLQARTGPAGGGQSDQIGVYSVEGLVLPHSPLAGFGARVLSPFVGRERELTILQELLVQVEEGRGQVVGIVGEPGMGKSRLLYEFRQRLTGRRVTYLEGHCLSYGSAIPYLPVLDLLRNHCGITEADSVEAMVEKVHVSLQEVGMAPDEWAPYLLFLLGIQAERERLAALPPETLKARTFETLRQLSLHSSRQQPLILAVEDLHWIDETSEAFLTSLVEKMGGAPLLLLATYRPEYRLPWLGKSYVTQIALQPLAPQDSLCVVRAVLQSEQVPDHLARVVLAKAEGNPFFLEEIGQTLVEQGGVELPPTVQGVLAARIDRLSIETKALLQTLAVLGKECSWSLLKQVVDQSEEELQRLLAHLQAAEFLYEQPGVPAPKYTFKHALTQDVAYASLPQGWRRGLHERAAQAIEALFPDRQGEHYSTLAHHYSRSGNTAKAVYYLQQAGHQAEQHSAYAEAISHLTMALELLPMLPNTPERMLQELRLQATLGQALMATKGFAVPEVEHIYARARELCRQVGETPHLFQVLWGLRSFYMARGELQQAHVLVEEMLSLAQHQQDAALLLEAHFALGYHVFFLGELGSAHAHLEQGIALYDPQQHHALAFVYSVSDPGVRCLAIAANVLVLLGSPDQALQQSHAALTLAQELAHPFSLGYALSSAAWLHQFRREVPRTQARAEALLALSREQGFALYGTMGSILRGWALAEQGQVAEGIAQMHEGLATRRTIGATVIDTYFLALLAEGYGRGGQPEKGLTLLAEAQTAVDKSGVRFYEAELYRLKGELLLAQAGTGHEVQEAEVCFRQALAVARRQQAKWLELRAAISLSRLWQQQGKRDAARHLLAQLYGWFTEGYETPDLREAKALLRGCLKSRP